LLTTDETTKKEKKNQGRLGVWASGGHLTSCLPCLAGSIPAAPFQFFSIREHWGEKIANTVNNCLAIRRALNCPWEFLTGILLSTGLIVSYLKLLLMLLSRSFHKFACHPLWSGTDDGGWVGCSHAHPPTPVDNDYHNTPQTSRSPSVAESTPVAQYQERPFRGFLKCTTIGNRTIYNLEFAFPRTCEHYRGDVLE
jgi:hypothetical protein